MQAIKFLLLAVFASVATAGFTWFFEGNTDNWPQGLYEKLNNVMNDATEYYSHYGDSIPTFQIKVQYDTNDKTTILAPALHTIRFGPNGYYHTMYWAIWAMSHLIGVGTPPGVTNAWKLHCKSGIAHWPLTTGLMEAYKGNGTKIGCNSNNFWPLGLNSVDEHNVDDLLKHVRLVRTMVHEGLQK